MSVENHLRDIRVSKKTTQKQLAENTGLSEKTIRLIEKNNNIPNIETALLLAHALDTKVDYIFSLSEDIKIYIERNMRKE